VSDVLAFGFVGNPVYTVAFAETTVVTQFIFDVKNDQQRACDPDGQANDIDERKTSGFSKDYATRF
jgi:hypothetical protein